MTKPSGRTWLPVPGFEGLYEVSDQGEIWSCSRRRGTRGGLLSTPNDGKGYRQVNLCRDGLRVHTLVHMVVAAAFHGPRPPGLECRHLDGDPSNNMAGNLAWGTSSENNLDLVRHGTHKNKYRDATHCIHGHEFTVENTRVTIRDGTVRRTCWTCRRRMNKEQAARRKAARHARRV